MKSRKPILVALTVVLVVLACELIGRFAYRLAYDDRQDLYLQAYLGVEEGLFPNHVVNYLPHHYLVYVLNPSARLLERNADRGGDWESRHYINSLGFRGRETTVEKPAGTFRVVCLGGSTTFGLFEYNEEHTYPALLEGWLNERFSQPRFEVINAGTPGWTSAENLINLELRLLELEPDMMVVYQGVNDTFAMRRTDEGGADYGNLRRIICYQRPSALNRSILKHSHLYRLLYVRTVGRANIQFDINALATRDNPPDWQENLDRATGRHFRRNLRSMVAVAKAHAVVPVLVTMAHGPWHRSLALTAQITREVAEEDGALLVDFERESRPGFFESDYVHLTTQGRAALASRVLDAVTAANPGFVPRQEN